MCDDRTLEMTVYGQDKDLFLVDLHEMLPTDLTRSTAASIRDAMVFLKHGSLKAEFAENYKRKIII